MHLLTCICTYLHKQAYSDTQIYTPHSCFTAIGIAITLCPHYIWGVWGSERFPNLKDKLGHKCAYLPYLGMYSLETKWSHELETNFESGELLLLEMSTSKGLVIKYHRLDGLSNRNVFSHSWFRRSLPSDCWERGPLAFLALCPHLSVCLPSISFLLACILLCALFLSEH